METLGGNRSAPFERVILCCDKLKIRARIMTTTTFRLPVQPIIRCFYGNSIHYSKCHNSIINLGLRCNFNFWAAIGPHLILVARTTRLRKKSEGEPANRMPHKASQAGLLRLHFKKHGTNSRRRRLAFQSRQHHHDSQKKKKMSRC